MNRNPQQKQVRMGLCPIGKFVFSHEDAVKQKVALQKKLNEWQVDFVDLDNVLPDGMVREKAHIDPVVEHFRKEDVDCIFVPHCNFGTEEAVGMIARKLGLPVLLWGPRDEAPLADGTRLRDSLCGMFASSKVMHKLGVKFSYIENCRMDEPALEQGVDSFLRAVNVARIFRQGIRIGHIGQRIDFFWTTIINESELLERFNVEIQPIDLVAFISRVKERVREKQKQYADEAAALGKEWQITGFDNSMPLINILGVRDQMLEEAEENGLDCLAMQDFTSLVDEMGAYCFAANSMVSDTIPVACESDIHGAISNMILHRANQGKRPVFLADITARHPEDDNGVLMWHAGAPISMCKEGAQVKLGHHWILPSPLAGMPHFPLRGGDITVARFDGDHGNYKLAFGEGVSMPGPDTQNNYVWMKVKDWPKWERILMEGPFIHHAAMAYGHTASAIKESLRFIEGLEGVDLDG